MSKAILILDEMPKSCDVCNLSRMYGSYCSIIGDIYVSEGNKSDDCPLKALPERINPLKVDANNLLNLGYMHGRNDLINEMEGNEDE